MKTELLTSIFSEEQLKVVKLIISKGSWGDTDMVFGTNLTSNYAWGYFTNMNKNKSFSGFMSGISKTIKSSGTTAVKHCSDWWQDTWVRC